MLALAVVLILLALPAWGVRADGGNPPGNAGPLTSVDAVIRQWGGYIFVLLTDIVIVAVAIVGIYKCLQGVTGGFLGMNGQTGAAIIGLVTIFLIVVLTFVVLPQIVKYLESIRPAVPF
jgi:hypothetical protein